MAIVGSVALGHMLGGVRHRADGPCCKGKSLVRMEARALRKIKDKEINASIRKKTRPERDCRACRYRAEGRRGGPEHSGCAKARKG